MRKNIQKLNIWAIEIPQRMGENDDDIQEKELPKWQDKKNTSDWNSLPQMPSTKTEQKITVSTYILVKF